MNRADPDRQRGPFSIAVTSIGEEAGRLRVPPYKGRGNKKGAHVEDRHTGRKIKGHAGGKSSVSAR